ncbi:MAG: hypothetical protein Q7R67_00925 [bacterium]|nr:hypothetical protein [bacterium]
MLNRARVVELVFSLFSVAFVWWLGQLVYSYPVLQLLVFGGFGLWLIVSELLGKLDNPRQKPEVQETPVSLPAPAETLPRPPLDLWVFEKGPSNHVH